MALEWSEKLSINNREIDDQHKELFARVNKLIDAMNQRKGKEEVANTIKFLETYVIEHFGTEERYMASVNYPNMTSHKQQHVDFKGRFGEIKKKFDEGGPSSILAIQINSQLGGWLLTHIPTIDKELARYIKKP